MTEEKKMSESNESKKKVTESDDPKKKSWPDCCEECTHDWQNKATLPDSNELLNIFLIVLGGLTIIFGIFHFFPDIFAFMGIGIVEPAAQTLLGVFGSRMLILGGWTLIAGIGMFQEQEYVYDYVA